MLYREMIAVCSQIHTKHINTLCGQNVEFLTVKPDGTCSLSGKWSEMMEIWSTEEIEYFQEQGLESDKWNKMKGTECEVGRRELRRGGMSSAYKVSELQVSVKRLKLSTLQYSLLTVSYT